MDLTAEPEISKESINSLANMKDGGNFFRLHRTRDGQIIHVEISAAPITLNGRTVICSIVRDVSERLRAENAVRESQENLLSLFETMDDIIVVGDTDGKILHTNSTASRKLGYTRDEFRTMHVLDLNPKSQRQEAEGILSEMFKGERTTCTLPLAKRDGIIIPTETRVWFGKWSGMDCVFGICKDLSREQEALQTLL